MVGTILGSLVVTLSALPGPAFATHGSFDQAENWTSGSFWASYPLGVETICGPTTDFQNVESYDGTQGSSIQFVRGSERAVVNLRWRGDLASRYTNPGNVNGARWCSGTLINDNLILTAGHCFDVDPAGWTFPRVNGTNTPITSQQAALEMTANFNFQNDPSGNPRTEQIFNVTGLVEYRSGGLDFAVVRIPTVARLSTALASGDPGVRAALTIMGHPAGMPKMVDGGTLSGIVGSGTTRRLQYGDIDTLGGNSGSGILNASGLLVGVHVEGGCTSTGGANNGVPITDILRASSVLRTLGRPGVYFADVDDDFKADAIVVNENGVTARRSSPNGGAFLGNETWTSNAYYGLRGTFFADVDGDGRADAIVVNDDRVTVRRSVRRSNGSGGFGPNEDWTLNPYFGSRGTFFADVDGDGQADAIVVNNDRVTVRRSNRSGFGPNEDWTLNPYFGSRGTFFADVDGDGQADAIVVNDNRVTVRRSVRRLDGSGGFGPNEDWTLNPYFGSRGTFFADVDGDGRADAIVVNDNRVTVRRSNGSSGFGPNEDWTLNPYFGSRGTFFADVDGDGRADAIVVNDNRVTVRPSVRRLDGSGGFGPNEAWTLNPYFGSK